MAIIKISTGSKTRTSAGFLLLGLLFIQLFVIACLPKNVQLISHELCLSGILIVLGLTLTKWKYTLIPLLVTLVALEYISKIFKSDGLNTLIVILNVLVLITIIGIYIFQTSREKKVNSSVILQSINGYLLLGVVSSLLIIIILRFDANAFSFPDVYNKVRLGQAQYLGLVTISTLGYGDIIPLAPIARSVTTFIALSGQLYVAIIIALLVGKFSSTK